MAKSKTEIKQMVAKAVDKHIPKAIESYAQSKAWSEVHKAMAETRGQGPETTDQGEAHQGSNVGDNQAPEKVTILPSNDPRISGSA